MSKKGVSTANQETHAPTSHTVHPTIPLLLFVLFSLAIAGLAAFVYEHEKRRDLEQAHDNLAAIATLKQQEIVDWLDDLKRDGKIMTDRRFLGPFIDKWISDGSPDDERRQKILARLKAIQDSYSLKSVQLLDDQGKVLLASGRDYNPPTASDVQAALQSHAVRITEPHLAEDGEPAVIHVDAIAPIYNEQQGQYKNIGALVLHVNLATQLFPLIQSWPTPSATGETLLVRQEGNQVLFLNELRHRKGTALKLRLPIAEELPAAQAIRGTIGLFEGLDYRGVRVLTELCPVPGTDWFLIAKQDEAEIYAPIHRIAWITFSLAAILIATASFGFWLWHLRRVAEYAFLNTQTELEKHRLETRFASLSRYANDIILWLDGQGVILDANERACAAYGFPLAELIGRPARELCALEQRSLWDRYITEILLNQEISLFEFVHRSKDGSLFTLEANGIAMEIDGGHYVQAILRDITERKLAERKQQRLADFYAALSQTNQSIMRIADVDVLFNEVCRIAVEYAHVSLAFIMQPDSASGVMRVLARHGSEAGYLDKVKVSVNESEAEGRGIIGTCFRTNAPVICNEVATDPRMRPWRNLWRSHALSSGAVFPIRRQGQVVSVLGLYTSQPNYWDADLIKLLNEMASDISFALDSLEVEAQRKKAEQELHLAASVFASTQEGIFITDAVGTIQEVNIAFTNLTGYTREDAVGQHARLLKSGYHDAEFYTALRQNLFSQGFWAGEIWSRKQDGSIFPAWLTLSSIRDQTGQIIRYIGTFTDISLRKQHEKQLERMAYYDLLTGIPNRALLVDRLEQAIAHSRRDESLLAVGYLDLDGFKPINDQFGHHAGDQLLIEISQRIKRSIREGDTVARLGGDEFVFLLLGMDKVEECFATLQRILAAIAKPVALQELKQNIEVSASIGVSLFPPDDADPDTLLRHADQSMYQAKQAGKNRFHIYDPMSNSRARALRDTLDRLESALENREFVLYYQPKVHLHSGQVVGAEALIRWQNPDHGLLPPCDFLPLIEGNPLGRKIDRWVMAEALRQMAKWIGQGIDLSVSVNVTAQTLQASDFIEYLSAQLAQYPAIDYSHYELEILETAALDDIAYISQLMRSCQNLGVRFALDDFGTGYSSLTYLRHLPSETLKIDQSFVRDMLDDEDDMVIVQGVIGLARAFHRQSVAEGVETIAHGTYLLRLGCDLAQGNGIARPMPAEKIPEWIQQWKPPEEWKG